MDSLASPIVWKHIPELQKRNEKEKGCNYIWYWWHPVVEWTGHISDTSGSHEPLLCSNSLLLRTFCAGLFKDSASSTWQIVLVLLWRSSSCSPFVLNGSIIAVYRSDKQQRMLMHISAKWLQCPLEHMSTGHPVLSENLLCCRIAWWGFQFQTLDVIQLCFQLVFQNNIVLS